MRCTRQRMQLVVIIAVLALARMGHGCHFGCHPINFSIPVKSCGLTVNVDTTICAGQCFHANPAYIGIADRDEHKVCNGDWTYEVKHIEGCPESISYAVARNCRCAACDPDKMYCSRFLEDIPSCLPF